MLTAEQVKFYHDNGYLVVENILDQTEIANALQAIEELTQGEGAQQNFELEPTDGNTIRRIWSPTKKHDTFWQIASNEDLVDKIACLIGQRVQFHYSKMNMKGPKVGSVVEWHQDFAYYPHTNSDLLTVLIALDGMQQENGCLKVIPGSHKHGLDSHYIGDYFRGKLQDIDEAQAVSLEVPAGGAIFLHCLTKHASAQNTSDKPRRTFLPAYRAGDAFPIYFGPHAAHNEAGAIMLRGEKSRVARVDEGRHWLPIAEREFGSIYEVQEGAHLKKAVSDMKTTGYAVD
ncbi:phytanoyl-CoA dioxygenase family protein [Pseudoalteromonas viridis]|uniref:Phytanoyl-CoA dioxygenase family protein n=1 Tax=Pseudoalteromonas viridis TaxID=339617 RepID=A0ABX7V7J5_9GAMM|nr:phytanoyl-CoA dioxygenase family protein [Pseudoalteromonas viridis]QTL36854.1 phytanoyl-CoA dioxygenase family protein [Pseudoalteromonas viridis]